MLFLLADSYTSVQACDLECTNQMGKDSDDDYDDAPLVLEGSQYDRSPDGTCLYGHGPMNGHCDGWDDRCEDGKALKACKCYSQAEAIKVNEGLQTRQLLGCLRNILFTF